MVKESITLLATILVIASLLIGGIVTYTAFPKETIKEVEVVKTVEIPVEVIKEVPVVTEVTKEVVAPSLIDKAVDTFMEAVDNEEDEAGNNLDLQEGYDFSDISVSKVYEDYNINVDDEVTTIDFKIRLRYDDATDDDRSEKITYNVRVIYEEDEDSIVEVL